MMLTSFRCLASFTAFAALLAFSKCPDGNPPLNTTGPSMVTLIQIGSPPPNTTTNAIDLNAADVNKSGIPSGISIRLLATITAPSSAPVTNVTVNSNLTWQCAFGGSQTIGIVQNAPLAFTPVIPTAPNSTSVNVNSVVDPIAMTGCATSKPGWGPINIRGNVRISATNSAGTSTSKSFLFDYQNVGTP
jgi:hypothetical protein